MLTAELHLSHKMEINLNAHLHSSEEIKCVISTTLNIICNKEKVLEHVIFWENLENIMQSHKDYMYKIPCTEICRASIPIKIRIYS